MSESLANSQLGAFTYDPAPESTGVVRLQSSYGLFIDGTFTEPSSHDQFVTLNPATEEVLATVAQSSDADICLLYTSRCV